MPCDSAVSNSWRFVSQPSNTRVCDHTYDLARRFITRKVDELADRIAIAEITHRQRLVNDGDPVSTALIPGRKVAAGKHSIPIVRKNPADVW